MASKPVILKREQNSVTISWEHLLESHQSTFIIQQQNDLREWKTIYWGPKTVFKIKDLSPCTCYDIRMRPETGSDWLTFKVATQEASFLVMHMTRAIKLANTSKIRKIAQSRNDLLNTENKDLKTPLIQAIELGDGFVVGLLIHLGANVNVPLLKNARTPLMVAVSSNQLEIANFLLEKRANLNSIDINGCNVLHYAVDSNVVENVRFALKLGLKINSKDRSGWTPLLRAAILGCEKEIIDILLEEGADPTCKDKNGFDFAKHTKLRNSVL